MYAVVKTGGKQYRVQEGAVLRFEKLPGDVGAAVSFDQVMMFSDGENVQIGQPVLENMAVHGHIVEQGKAKKIIVFKYKRRKRYRRKQGHRQQYTTVRIDSIGGPAPELTQKPGSSEETGELEQKTQAAAQSAAPEPVQETGGQEPEPQTDQEEKE